MRRKGIICAAAAVVGALGGVLAAPTPGEEMASDTATKRVAVRDNFFDPRSVSIRRGDRVTWVWRGENSHNVTFVKVPRGASDHGADTRRSGRYTRSFRRRGLYKFVCTIHYGQRGTIDVK
jgi:plastocyanin